jgi:hypothetical protein
MALKNWGVASHKKLTLFLWRDVKTSLVHLGLRFIPLNKKACASVSVSFAYLALQGHKSNNCHNLIKEHCRGVLWGLGG